MGAYSRDGYFFEGGGGAYSIISPIGWVLIQGGAYLRGRLFEAL